MIDNQLRSVLFQIPVPENPTCLDGAELPACYEEIVDLGALDIQRARDHGIPSYNDLRVAYGLEPVSTFAEITGEGTDQFPTETLLTAGEELDDPDSLGVVEILVGDVEVPLEEQETFELFTAVTRRTPVAARLRAIYGEIENVDAFVGLLAEPHTDGAEMGELQMAIWRHQFQALRDADRFFYGIDYRHTLAELITLNTEVTTDVLPPDINVFFSPEEEAEAGSANEGSEPARLASPEGPADGEAQPSTNPDERLGRPSGACAWVAHHPAQALGVHWGWTDCDVKLISDDEERATTWDRLLNQSAPGHGDSSG